MRFVYTLTSAERRLNSLVTSFVPVQTRKQSAAMAPDPRTSRPPSPFQKLPVVKHPAHDVASLAKPDSPPPPSNRSRAFRQNSGPVSPSSPSWKYACPID